MLAGQLWGGSAAAQARADAGAPRQDRVGGRLSPTPPELPSQRSRFFPKAIPASALLSERVQATLAERARAAQPAPMANTAEAPPTVSPAPAPPAAPPTLSEAAARRGEARLRRVQSIETDDGVTILSNRFLDSPDPRRAASRAPLVRSQPQGETVINEPQVTETRSLRTAEPTLATREEGDTSEDWQLPLLVFVAAGLISGAVWLRMKGNT